ncbi:hypothetical protein OGAPHI_005422 [Ogataea philodendri]|uniref:Fe2OG dioxygenase domain-containing protein n=1 Tax=Ogataea philodendri TaxID=1378263 RepID=A0A9P8P014_9ASCO|nr:uncharacterized protein OGAPHI_005422 [Ogataea philodendri]KAH3662174.1 hypothetical protein OGAPHI_005422 [Ogataea philodendri]
MEFPRTWLTSHLSGASGSLTLPLQNKMKCPHPPSPCHHTGYSNVGQEKVSQLGLEPERDLVVNARKHPDVKESFEMNNEKDTLYYNFWPEESDIPGFREFMVEFWKTCETTSKHILEAIALGMGLEEDYLVKYHSDGINQLRLLHYPPTKQVELETGEKERIGAHTDFGTLTMLFQDSTGGLEIEDPHSKDRFVPGHPIPGTVVVNIGDLLMRWSNNRLKSTLHRVRAPPGTAQSGISKARYSIPYFVNPNRDVAISCLPGCWSPGEPKVYDSINAQQYIEQRMNPTY